MAESQSGLRLAAVFVLVAAAAALSVALFEPDELPTWLRLLLGGLSVCAALAIALVGFRRLSGRARRVATRVARLVFVLIAATLVVVAVTYAEVASWLRWGLVVLAVVIVAVGRMWPRVAWPDVAFCAALGLAAVALIAQSLTEPPKVETKTARFELTGETVTALEALEVDEDVVLLVVKETPASQDAPVSHQSARYEAVATTTLSQGRQTGVVPFLVKRGEDDASASSFGADLQSAKIIYVISG